eukprot:362918-Chlamydomonas_euryale.AAC.3
MKNSAVPPSNMTSSRSATRFAIPAAATPVDVCLSVAEDGRVEQLKLRQGPRNIKDFLGCTTVQSGVAMRKIPALASFFRTSSSCMATLNRFLSQRAAAAELALDRQAWHAIHNLAPLESKQPQQAGCMTRSCARRGKSGKCWQWKANQSIHSVCVHRWYMRGGR